MIEEDFNKKILKAIAIVFGCALLFLIIVMFVLSSGCVTAAKTTYKNMVSTPAPVPTLTPIITEEPIPTEPTPEPTPDYSTCDPLGNCYKLGEWHFWFRPNVEGINSTMDTGDLKAWVTVYGYKVLPSYHYYDISWARNFLVKPDDKNDEFLFIYVNMYLDENSVRQYGFNYNHFAVQIKDRLYYPDFFMYPERRIVEFDQIQNYGRTESIFPYGFKRHQEAGTGIITAEKLDYIMSGRSNAFDGYIIFQVPYNSDLNQTKVAASFDNLGGNVWWKLK